MPSSSILAFRGNIVDVDRLIESHGPLHDGSPGKKGLGHITRSGVVMLCAAWELYLESLCVKAANYFRDKCQSPDQLPSRVQKELAKMARESKHELKTLEFAGDGWKQVLVTPARELCGAINAPKQGQSMNCICVLLNSKGCLIIGYAGKTQSMILLVSVATSRIAAATLITSRLGSYRVTER